MQRIISLFVMITAFVHVLSFKPQLIRSGSMLHMGVEPRSPRTEASQRLVESSKFVIGLSILGCGPEVVNAFKFEAIERDQRPIRAMLLLLSMVSSLTTQPSGRILTQ